MTNEYFTEAIVLDKEPVGEADLYVYLYTQELGRITARAISARKITSKLAAHLEPLNVIQARLIQKNRFHLADALRHDSLPRTTSMLSVLKLTKDLTGEGQPDSALWEILKSGQATGASVLGALGFDGQYATCENCGNERPSHFVFGRLEYLCLSCFSKSGKPAAFTL